MVAEYFQIGFGLVLGAGLAGLIVLMIFGSLIAIGE